MEVIRVHEDRVVFPPEAVAGWDVAARGERLVGRDSELDALRTLIHETPDRGGGIVVSGPAGIGKTSVVQAAAAMARESGLRVVATAGVEAEAELPFAALHQLLRPLSAVTTKLPQRQRDALEDAFGVSRRQSSSPEPFLVALAALNVLVEAAAHAPIAVIVDDVQWIDRASHDALTFIARRVEYDHVAVVVALRDGYDSPLVAARLPRVELGPLDDSSARVLLNASGGDLATWITERVLSEAGGNPLALVELPVAWRAAERQNATPATAPYLPLTERLERSFAGRLFELPTASRDAVLIAAVDTIGELGPILAGTSALSGVGVGPDVLQPAVTAGLLHFDEMHVRFRHPLVRSGVLNSETPARRQAANAAMAAAVSHEPYRHAWHRAQSITGPDDAVADELEEAHRLGLRRGSATSAIQILERSAQLTTDPQTRGRRLLLAAEHAYGLGRADLVDRLVTAAESNRLADLDLGRVEWLREIFNDGVPGDVNRVAQLCELAEQAAAVDDTDLALNLLLGAALRCWWAETAHEARTSIVRAAECIRGLDGDPRFISVLAVAEPVGCGTRVSHLLETLGTERVTDGNALRLLGMAAHAIGDSIRATDYLEQSEHALRVHGRLGLLPHVLAMQLNACLAIGDWARAAQAADDGRRLAEETGQSTWINGTIALNAEAAGLRGDTETAFQLAGEAERLANRRRLSNLLCCVQVARGFAWASAGRYSEAYEALRRTFDPADASYHLRESFTGVAVFAESAVHIAEVANARRVMRQLELVARTTPSPLLSVGLAYARAILADDKTAEQLYHSALSADLVRWPWPRARLLLAYGSWLRRQRRIAESREPLRSAQMTFDVIGATAWSNQARSELRAAGERVEAGERRLSEILSAQELRIARLAAEGLSNRDIGERLYLSPRTVGSHLYRIFPKLGITSRTQLSSRLAAS